MSELIRACFTSHYFDNLLLYHTFRLFANIIRMCQYYLSSTNWSFVHSETLDSMGILWGSVGQNIYWASMKSITLLFLYFLKSVRMKENKWCMYTFLGIFIVSITKQQECILNDIRVYEHNQNTIENRNILSLIPCVTTSCCDNFLASSWSTSVCSFVVSDPTPPWVR